MLSPHSVVTARDALEQLYTDACDVAEYAPVQTGASAVTRHEVRTVLSDLPCRLSFETPQAARGTPAASDAPQSVRLFCAPEAVIRPGSRITVRQAGRTEVYGLSGRPAVYPTHQELCLVPFEGWC